MKVLCGDIVNFFEKIAPGYFSESWDNVGLLIGNINRKLDRILLCLDVTSKVLQEAIDNNVDMIISHHPIIFKQMCSILENAGSGSIIYKLIKNDICVFAAHTNLDVSREGVNKNLAETLCLNDIKCMNINKLYSSNEMYFGLGAVGNLNTSMSMEDFLPYLKSKLAIKNLRVAGYRTGNVEKVAVFCGSFDDNIASVIDSGADVLVTGDVKYHTAVNANEMGLCIVDAGHFSTEYIIIRHLHKMITDTFPGITIINNSIESEPFIFY